MILVTSLCWLLLVKSVNGFQPADLITRLIFHNHHPETTDSPLRLRPSPLIGGPKWLPLHVQLVIENQYAWDFVPQNATSPVTLRNLLLLKSVPGEIRCKTIKVPPCSNDNDGAAATAATMTTSLLQQQATNYSQLYQNTNLNLVTNNCWTFCLGMLIYLLSSSSTLIMDD